MRRVEREVPVDALVTRAQQIARIDLEYLGDDHLPAQPVGYIGPHGDEPARQLRGRHRMTGDGTHTGNFLMAHIESRPRFDPIDQATDPPVSADVVAGDHRQFGMAEVLGQPDRVAPAGRPPGPVDADRHPSESLHQLGVVVDDLFVGCSLALHAHDAMVAARSDNERREAAADDTTSEY